jgi:hypothetical protein
MLYLAELPASRDRIRTGDRRPMESFLHSRKGGADKGSAERYRTLRSGRDSNPQIT